MFNIIYLNLVAQGGSIFLVCQWYCSSWMATLKTKKNEDKQYLKYYAGVSLISPTLKTEVGSRNLVSENKNANSSGPPFSYIQVSFQ